MTKLFAVEMFFGWCEIACFMLAGASMSPAEPLAVLGWGALGAIFGAIANGVRDERKRGGT